MSSAHAANPLYQVLALEEPPAVSLPAQRAGQALSVKDVLQHLFQSGGQP